MKPWLEPLIWTDYRLALLFTVVVPLVLLIWAFVQSNESIQRLLMIYWKVASLLAITVYLMIASVPLSFISGLMGRLLIPLALWFWVDLNEDIVDQTPSPLKLSFTSWRWAMTLYNVIGAIAMIPFLQCAFSSTLLKAPFCSTWLQPTWLFKEYFHANTSPRFLGFLGFVGLIIYVGNLTYFVLVKLSRQGRSALEQ